MAGDVMVITLEAQPVPLRQEEDGTLRVGDTRVTLDTILIAFNHGESPESIADAFDAVTLPDVYAVVAFYLRNKPEIDAYLHRRALEAEEMRKKIESQPGYSELRQEILRRARERGLR